MRETTEGIPLTFGDSTELAEIPKEVWGPVWPMVGTGQLLSPFPLAERLPMLQSTVLVVDDDPEIANMLKFILARRGVRVLAAASGAEACLTAVLADVVLCDLALGTESGVDVALALRARQITAPIVLMSGLASAEDPGRSAPRGLFTALLRKPFLVDDLCGVLEQCGVDCQPTRQGVWTARQAEPIRASWKGTGGCD